MTPDRLAALSRALSLAALFQAVGGALFLGYVGARAGVAGHSIRRLVRGAAVAGILLIAAEGCIETARLSGDFTGIGDLALQRLFWTSPGGLVLVLQMVAMALIAACIAGRTRRQRFLRVIGSLAGVAALAGSGHTRIHPLRAVLAPMLIVHVTVGACWFGSLAPLLLVLRTETTARSTVILAEFSRIAGVAVPLLGVVGLATAFVLVPRLSDWLRPYGLLLMTKIILFALLLIVASYNRWKHVPAMTAGSATATTALRRSIGWEIALIAAVLAATSLMATYFSPPSS